jgi:phage tail-like protein
MSGFVVNTHRFDPYKSFKFVVGWMEKGQAGRAFLGVSKVSPLKRTTEVVTHRSGGDNSHDRKSPGRTTYEGITLERGITHDTQFEQWANQIHKFDGDKTMDLAKCKRDLYLEVHNERGQVAMTYRLWNCWVSEYTALPDLDANANAIAIESVKIELEGWERATEVTEPEEAAQL